MDDVLIGSEQPKSAIQDRDDRKRRVPLAFYCEGKCRICPFPGALCAYSKENSKNSTIIDGGKP